MQTLYLELPADLRPLQVTWFHFSY